MHKILPFVFIALLITPTLVYAQNATPSSTPRTNGFKEKPLITAEKNATVLKNALDRKADREASRAARLEELKKRRDAFKDELAAKRKEAQAEFKAERAQFQARLAAIKDEEKQAIVEKIDAKLSTINEEKTNKMSEALEKLSEILSRISEKASSLETEGKDTTALDEAIAAADTALSTAEAAVSEQAGKEYVITITTETALRSTVGTTTSQMQTDLRDTHKAVVAAKQAIMTAAKELGLLVRGGGSATPSATLE